MLKLTWSVACDVLFIKLMHSNLGSFNENTNSFKVFLFIQPDQHKLFELKTKVWGFFAKGCASLGVQVAGSGIAVPGV